MNAPDQPVIPKMKEIEDGLLLTPPYDSILFTVEIRTDDWQHVCSCRFGEPRLSGLGLTWSGDCYRYDIFTAKTDKTRTLPRIALRWSNGGGVGWLTDQLDNRSDETHLLSMISEVESEARRWDFCHKLWETHHRTARAATRSEANRIFGAFCDGKLKRRRRDGRYVMEILQ